MSGEDAAEPRPPMMHDLKTIDPYWSMVVRGDKTFEVRKADRDFRIGDRLNLRLWERDGYIAHADQKVRVTYVLDGGQFGIEPGYVVLGIELIHHLDEDLSDAEVYA